MKSKILAGVLACAIAAHNVSYSVEKFTNNQSQEPQYRTEQIFAPSSSMRPTPEDLGDENEFQTEKDKIIENLEKTGEENNEELKKAQQEADTSEFEEKVSAKAEEQAQKESAIAGRQAQKESDIAGESVKREADKSAQIGTTGQGIENPKHQSESSPNQLEESNDIKPADHGTTTPAVESSGAEQTEATQKPPEIEH